MQALIDSIILYTIETSLITGLVYKDANRYSKNTDIIAVQPDDGYFFDLRKPAHLE